MSAIAHTLRTRLLGIGFIVLLAALIAMSILQFQHFFTPVVNVTLQTDQSGNQLNLGADVKLRGVIVGDVRSITTTGDGARIGLALQPDSVGLIPANVMARLLPKTLFGEKYVSLVTDGQPSGQSIRGDQTIYQDKSVYSAELQKVLNELLPLLRTLQPEKLSVALNAVATALRGRGETLGQTLVDLDDYLGQLNQSLPDLAADIRQLATVSNAYADAAPDILALLKNLTTTANTVVDQKNNLQMLFASTTVTADTTRQLLEANGNQIIQVADDSRPILQLLAEYSPEYPCFFKGLADTEARANKIIYDNRIHVTLEVSRSQGKYLKGHDEPQYGANSGPNCWGMPNPPVPFPAAKAPSGYDFGLQRNPLPLGGAATSALTDGGVSGKGGDMGTAGTTADQQTIDLLLAPELGVPPSQVPPVATLLFGPMARGTEASLS
ncbi:MCE family protein [Fodinicola acaciae]|uniref:MCE family protein n=1 Tax=Fodinicola acaciae TaxID=2681555 RepID=UPI0013D513CB|nr:MCE family protein [Fodinicola acaciae]